MNPERWQQLKSVFDEALQLDPSQRPGYIDEGCALDPELRKEIESILSAHEQVREEYLDTPAAGLDAFQDLGGADPWIGKHIGPYQLVRELGRLRRMPVGSNCRQVGEKERTDVD